MKHTKLILVSILLIGTLFGCSNNSKAQKANPEKQSKQQVVAKPADNQPTNTTTEIQENNVSSPLQKNADNDPWAKINPTKVNVINTQQFKQLIFDYTTSNTWEYKGDKPCVIDFYADWCKPCRLVAPIMEQLAQEYNGQVYFYKLNVDYNREVAQVFGIRSIPSVLFCPLKGQPRMAIGAMPKESYIRAIKEIMGVEHPNSK